MPCSMVSKSKTLLQANTKNRALGVLSLSSPLLLAHQGVLRYSSLEGKKLEEKAEAKEQAVAESGEPGELQR